MFNNAGVRYLIFITPSLSHTNTCQTVQWCLRALSQQPVRNRLVTAQQSKWQLSSRKRGKIKTTRKHGWPPAVLLSNLMVLTWFPLQHSPFIYCASDILSGVSRIRKTSGPRAGGDGPDEARETLLFIRPGLNRFHRCQSGKVTVTAPIRKNGQNGNKASDLKSALRKSEVAWYSIRADKRIRLGWVCVCNWC